MHFRLLPVVCFSTVVCLVIGQWGCSSSEKKPEVAPAAPSAKATEAEPEPSVAKSEFPEMTPAEVIKDAGKYKSKDVIVNGTLVEKRGTPDQPGVMSLVVSGTQGERPVNVSAALQKIDSYTAYRFKKLKAGDSVKFIGTVWSTDYTITPGKPDELVLITSKIIK